MSRRFYTPRLLAALAAQALVGGTFAQESQPGDAPPPKPAAAESIPAELMAFQGRPIHAVVLRPAPGIIVRSSPKPEAGKNAKPDQPTPEAAKGGGEGGELAPITPELDRLVRNQLRAQEGAPFDASLVMQDVSRLNRLGRFSRVDSQVQLLADGSVDLIYLLRQQPTIRDVQTVGNKEINDQDLAKYIDILVGTPVDPTRLDRACRSVEAAYREKGYFNCLVTVDQKELNENGNVYFKIREGEKVKVTEIRFEGNVSYSGDELRTVVKTKTAWLFDRGRLDYDVLADDVASVIAFYRDRGHIDARADRSVRPSPDGKEAVVVFIVDEGPVYTLRNVSVAFPPDAERVYTAEQITGLMTLKPGDVYSERKLRRSLLAIRDAYGKMGYAETQITTRERRDLENPQVDLVVNIQERPRVKTGEIITRGNTLTRDDVLRREIQLQPDRPLDTTAMTESQRRLERTNLFAPRSVKLTLQRPQSEDPQYRDVLVEVDETNTGNFSIGGAVNSDSGLSANVSIRQRNFDVTDFPDSFGELFTGEAFRGGGQTFYISASPGTERQYYTIGLTDPYLFESDYSGNVAGFFLNRSYQAYDETRLGGRFGIGRRFGSRWIGSMPVRVENIDLSNIDSDAPDDYYKVADNHLLTGVGFTLSRTSLDDTVFPSKGNKIEFGFEQVMGDYTFTILRGEYSVYTKLNEDIYGRKTTLKWTSRAEYIPQAYDDVPFYERFYLGGQSFRGFNFRAVSPVGYHSGTAGGSTTPKQTDDPVGGNFLFFAGVELKQPIYEDLLAGVVFIDTGTVDDSVDFTHYRVSAGFGFRLYVQALSPIPLAFDFGFPILREDTDRERVFSFSVDVPFH